MGYVNELAPRWRNPALDEPEKDYEPQGGWQSWQNGNEEQAAPQEPQGPRSFLEEVMHQIKDAAPQLAKVGSHALGSYGNLESMLKAGLRAAGLSPRFMRGPQYFPTTEDVEHAFGSPHEPTTGLGKFTSRASGLVGDILPLNVPGATTAKQALQGIGAAGAGHVVQEASGSPIAATLAELGTLAYMNAPKGHFQSFEGPHGEKLRELEKLGLSEPSLIMTGKAMDRNKTLFGTAGSSIEPFVENMTKEANEAYHSFFRKTLPPNEEALKAYFEEAYGALQNEARSIEMPKKLSLKPEIEKMREEVFAGTITHPEAEAQARTFTRSAKRIEKGRSRVKIEPTPEEIAEAEALEKPLKVKRKPLTAQGIVKDIRTINSHHDQYAKFPETATQAEKYKNVLYDVLAESGPEGEALVEQLREVDQQFIKSLDQKKAMKIADSWVGSDGIDFKKVKTSLNSASQRNTLIEATSPETVKKLQELTEGVNTVAKAYGSGGNTVTNVISALAGGAATTIGKSIVSGTFGMGDLFSPALIGISAVASRYLAKQMLTNPEYQNLGIKYLNAIRKGSVRTALLLKKDIKEKVEKDKNHYEKHPS